MAIERGPRQPGGPRAPKGVKTALIFDAINFLPDALQNEKPAPDMSEHVWSRFMTPVTGTCVMDLTLKERCQLAYCFQPTTHTCKVSSVCFCMLSGYMPCVRHRQCEQF